jgi:ketosteroid isomerase-like protein
MSQENVEIIKGLLEGFAAGDRGSWRDVVAEDVVWDASAAGTMTARIYKGHKGVEQFFVEWLEVWEDPTFELLGLIDAGDSVVATFRWCGRGGKSGVQVEQVFFAVYDVRDRKVAGVRQFETRAEALEAAGLSE